MILLTKKFIPLTALLLLLMVSCGKKNKTTSSQISSTPTTTNGVSVAVNNEINRIKSEYPCSGGGRTDLTFSGTAPDVIYSNSALRGDFNRGAISGTAISTYVGRSGCNDLIIVSKMDADRGFNVTLSLCPDDPFIIPGRSYGNLMRVRYEYLVLDDDTSSGLGSVDSGFTEFEALEYKDYNSIIVGTQFAKINNY